MANSKKDSIDEFLNEITTGEAEVEQKVNAPVANSKVEVEHERKFNRTELKRKSLVNTYRNEDKVAISISPFYAPYLGKVVRQIVNGIVVDIPCDGRTYQVNESHASHILAKVRRVNDMIARQERAGDIKNNFEYSPGQLHL